MMTEVQRQRRVLLTELSEQILPHTGESPTPFWTDVLAGSEPVLMLSGKNGFAQVAWDDSEGSWKVWWDGAALFFDPGDPDIAERIGQAIAALEATWSLHLPDCDGAAG